MKQIYLLGFFLLAAATPAEAAVSINEIAWMGGVDSANYEWIEIYNSEDSALSVDGWTLSDGINLNINLAGTIGSNAYAVLERTSEESAPGTAFVIYTGAMVNTGATLILKDKTGAIIDQVTGGTDWQNIGGDNTTKETAQYKSTGWVTDEATPGAVNGPGRVEEVVLPEEEVVVTPVIKSSSGSSKKNSGDSVRLRNPETKMNLLTDIQNIGYVNQVIVFRAQASGISDGSSRLVRFEWNFGDSYYATSSKAVHSYKYPGTYVVTAYAKKDQVEQTTRHEITILPVTFSITKDTQGDIQINNDAAYDIDVSGYVLKGEESIILPPRTIIAARGTITIDSKRLMNESENLVALYDTEKNLVASTFDSSYVSEGDFEEELAFLQTEEPLSSFSEIGLSSFENILPEDISETMPFNFVTKVAQASEGESAIETANIELKAETQKLPIENKSDEPRWPYLALIILLLVATIGILVGKKQTQ
jgi:Lamin Tail Domain/PKD domain